MAQVTTKNYLIHKAPKRIELLGDRTKRPEPATHIIEFPGGAVELSRTTDGNYWAHIIVNRDFALPGEIEGLEGAYGEIVGSRMDYEFPTEPNIVVVPDASKLRQIAILIKPLPNKIENTDSLPNQVEVDQVNTHEHIRGQRQFRF
jgi:hypothetical protein